MLSMKVKVTFCGSGHSVAPPLLHLEEAAEGGGGGDLQLVHHLQLPLLRLGSDFLTHNLSLDFVNFPPCILAITRTIRWFFSSFHFITVFRFRFPIRLTQSTPHLTSNPIIW